MFYEMSNHLSGGATISMISLLTILVAGALFGMYAIILNIRNNGGFIAFHLIAIGFFFACICFFSALTCIILGTYHETTITHSNSLYQAIDTSKNQHVNKDKFIEKIENISGYSHLEFNINNSTLDEVFDGSGVKIDGSGIDSKFEEHKVSVFVDKDSDQLIILSDGHPLNIAQSKAN